MAWTTVKKMEPVRAHVVQLFDGNLRHVHELPPEYRSWMQAAAMMQDVGKYMNHQGHLRHNATYCGELGKYSVSRRSSGRL